MVEYSYKNKVAILSNYYNHLIPNQILFFSSAFAVEGSIPEPDVVCFGSLENFSSIISPAFRASTVFVGLAVLMSILCLVAMLLFCFMKDQSVYEICATIQALQGKYDRENGAN